MIPLNWWKTARFIVETANEKTVISWRRSMLGDNGEGCLIVQLNGYGCTWSMQWAKEFGFIDKFNQATLSWFNLNKPGLPHSAKIS